MSPSTSNVYRTEYLRLRNTEIVSFCSIRTLLCIESKAIEYLKSTLFPSSKKQSQIRSKVYKIVYIETSFLTTNRLNINIPQKVPHRWISIRTSSMWLKTNLCLETPSACLGLAAYAWRSLWGTLDRLVLQLDPNRNNLGGSTFQWLLPNT